jgi:fimbrial chaperone protein
MRNAGSEPTVVQVEVSGWAQSDNQDIYGATQDLLVTPPIFTIPPGGSQVIRVGLRRAQDPANELSYRVFMQELPPPAGPGFQGLQMALRIGVPVFVAASARPRSDVTWRAAASGDGVKLVLVNGGSVHLKIVDIALTAAGGKSAATVAHTPIYVLPGQRHEWMLKLSAPAKVGTTFQVQAHTDSGTELEARLTLDAS